MSNTPRNAGYPQYQTEPEGVWAFGKARGLDGYSIQSMAGHFGWRAIESWGRDGWGLGSWPLIVVFHRDKDGHFDLALYCEGDVTEYHFPTEELRERATNEIALFYWRWLGEPFVEGIVSAEEMPEWLRGPYSEQRAREHDVSGTVLAYHVHASCPSLVPGYVDTMSTYYDPRDLDTARRGFVERRAEYIAVVLDKEWQFETGESQILRLATYVGPSLAQAQKTPPVVE